MARNRATSDRVLKHIHRSSGVSLARISASSGAPGFNSHIWVCLSNMANWTNKAGISWANKTMVGTTAITHVLYLGFDDGFRLVLEHARDVVHFQGLLMRSQEQLENGQLNPVSKHLAFLLWCQRFSHWLALSHYVQPRNLAVQHTSLNASGTNTQTNPRPTTHTHTHTHRKYALLIRG